MSQFMTEADAEILPVGMLTVASRSKRQVDEDDEEITTEATEELLESTETTESPESLEVIETTESIAGLDEFAYLESEFVEPQEEQLSTSIAIHFTATCFNNCSLVSIKVVKKWRKCQTQLKHRQNQRKNYWNRERPNWSSTPDC